MEARMKNPVMVLPGAMQAMMALAETAKKGGVSPKTLELVHLRASQINGCSVCVDMTRAALKTGETIERLLTVSAWRDAPYFTDDERAALALTEAVTRLADREDPVPDDIWEEATRHFDERALAAIIMMIATTNVWNRVNATTRQVAGEWEKSPEARAAVERAHAA